MEPGEIATNVIGLVAAVTIAVIGYYFRPRSKGEGSGPLSVVKGALVDTAAVRDLTAALDRLTHVLVLQLPPAQRAAYEQEREAEEELDKKVSERLRRLRQAEPPAD